MPHELGPDALLEDLIMVKHKLALTVRLLGLFRISAGCLLAALFPNRTVLHGDNLDFVRDLLQGSVNQDAVGVNRLKGSEDLPDSFELIVPLEDFLRRLVISNHERDDDIASLLSRGLSHNPAHGLYDVDLGLPRGEEYDRVKRGDVNALG